MVEGSKGFIEGLFNQIDTLIQHFILEGYQGLAHHFAPAITGLFVLFLVLIGYSVMLGLVELSLNYVAKQALIAGIVLMLALSWGSFAQTLYAAVTEVPNEAASAILSALPDPNYTSPHQATEALQQAWDQGMGYVKLVWKCGGKLNPLPYLWATVMVLLLVVLVAVALAELMVAKFLLALLLVLTPLMVPMYLFSSTRQLLFDGWLQNLVSYACIPLFVLVAMALGLLVLHQGALLIEQVVATPDSFLKLVDLAPYTLCLLLVILLMMKASQLAASLGRGVSHSTSSQSAQWLKQRVQSFLS